MADNGIVISNISLIYSIIYFSAGALITFAINEFRDWRKEKKTKSKQIASLKTLMNVEINQNLELLKKFGNEMKNTDELKEDINGNLHGNFLTNKLPPFETNIWNKQTSILTEAFNAEEIKGFLIFYNSLNQLSDIQSRLKYIRQVVQLRFYNQYAAEEWIKGREILKELQKKGNSLDSENDFKFFIGYI